MQISTLFVLVALLYIYLGLLLPVLNFTNLIIESIISIIWILIFFFDIASMVF